MKIKKVIKRKRKGVGQNAPNDGTERGKRTEAKRYNGLG